jgi:hypothetical protein
MTTTKKRFALAKMEPISDAQYQQVHPHTDHAIQLAAERLEDAEAGRYVLILGAKVVQEFEVIRSEKVLVRRKP